MLTWFTTYKDNSRHDYVSGQYDIGHIDKDKIDTLVIHNPNLPTPVLVIHFDDPRKRPIYVRRVENPGRFPFKTVCHIAGWQMKIGDENIQSISYVFETQGRVVEVEYETPEGEIKKKPIRQELSWVENAGAFDEKRNHWFKSPAAQQLNVIGSKAK